MAEIEIEIDGRVVNAEPGEMLIAVTDREGISVPRFCYHKKLSVAASCRMCLVDVEGAPKPQPACSTPVSEGMKVQTQNERAKTSQKAVMEFLLINHPLDCPICDQGGECELQDVAMEYGSDVSNFTEGKRVVADKDISPLIQTDMTRCIHCTRCVRFGAEIGGVMEMGGTGRGDALKIEPFLAEGITSELSGNMIDVCPVGALTSKPFRYALRSWQMSAKPSIARHDLVGSNVFVQTFDNQVKRVVSGDNDKVNETWISDRDRFSYEGLSHDKRLLAPKIKVEGEWKEVEWSVALDYAVRGLNNHVVNSRQGDKLGVLAGHSATLEEYHLLQKFARELGSENVDYRLNVKSLDQSIHLLNKIKLAGLEGVDHALVIGANPRFEQPMINHRLRKAQLGGASIDTLNVKAFDFNYTLNSDNIVSPAQIKSTLAGALKTVLELNVSEMPAFLEDVVPSDTAKAIAQQLNVTDDSVIVVGEHVINNPDAADIANLVNELAEHTNSTTLNLTQTGNALGAEMAGFVPGLEGLNVNQMLAEEMRAYVLLDVYPSYDFHHSAQALEALSSDTAFVVAMNSFEDESLNACADVLLPIASCFETSGSHVNINNDIQSFAASVKAPEEAKPAWKVIKVLADLLDLPGFHYADSMQVLSEVSHHAHKAHEYDHSVDLGTEAEGVQVIWQSSPYATDALLRHAPSLQATKLGQLHSAFMNENTAKTLGVEQTYLGVPVAIDESMANDCVFVSANQSTNGGQS